MCVCVCLHIAISCLLFITTNNQLKEFSLFLFFRWGHAIKMGLSCAKNENPVLLTIPFVVAVFFLAKSNRI